MAKNKKTWFKSKKCQVLTINKNKPFSINLLINKTKIPAVKFFKDLGKHISENLKWNKHISYLYKIAQNSSYQILKSFKTSSASILTKLLKSTFALNSNTIPQYGHPIKKKTLLGLSLCREILPVLFVLDATFQIPHTKIDWWNSDWSL